MCSHVEQQEVLFLCGEDTFLDQIFCKTLPDVSQLVVQLQGIPGLSWRTEFWNVRDTSQCDISKNVTVTGKLSHHLAALSSSGLSLEVGSLLCALRPHLVAHRLSEHLTCRLPLQTKRTCLNWGNCSHLSQTNNTSCVNKNHNTWHGWVCTEKGQKKTQEILVY